jgi:hypothetical protein
MHQISDENDRAKEGKSPGLKKRVRARRQPSRSEFVKWLELQPDVKIAYELKESLCDIYRCKRRFTAQNALKKWEASIRTLEEQEPQIDDSILNPFRDLLQTITKWKTEFLAFFPEGKSNGYTEAFNSVLKRMNRSGNNYTFDVLRARVLFGRKPQHETVKLKPPSLESFLRDSQPQSEICLLCGQSFTSDEFAFTANDPMPGQSVVMHNNDLEAPKCPLCQKRINSRMLENLVLSRPAEEKFSKEYFEDTEVGDVKSAARFSRTICDSCGKTSDTDRLHPWGLMFLGGNYLYICDACLEEIHGRGENEGTCNEMTAQPCTNGEPDKASLIDDLKGLMVSAPPLQPVTSCPSPGIDQHHHHNDEVSVPVIRKLPRRRILAKELGCASPSRVRPKQLLLFPER